MAQHEHQRRVEISVTPRYLVPDTNCFIEHLHSIKRLLQAQKYMLIVPIIGTVCMLIVPMMRSASTCSGVFMAVATPKLRSARPDPAPRAVPEPPQRGRLAR